MILVDTSVWIGFLRDAGTEVCEEVNRLLTDEVAISDVIRMEILAGAHDEVHPGRLRRLLGRTVTIYTLPTDYDHAAALYRHCRRRGETVRKLVDCPIAAVAIRANIAILRKDADFDTLARRTEMEVHRPDRQQFSSR